jgi:RHS repeat-associated protein
MKGFRYILQYYTHQSSVAALTNRHGEFYQHLQYLPYGDVFVDKRRGFFASPYTFSAKEKDSESGYNYFGARYYTDNIMMWLSVDPMSDKYPSMSPYMYCAGNPIKFVDPDGESYGDYYDIFGNFLWNDGVDDGKIYEVIPASMLPIDASLDIKARDLIQYVGQVESVRLSYTGETNKNNTAMAEGQLDVIQIGSNGKEYTRMSIDAVGGPYGNGAPANGDYLVDNPRERKESGYVRDGFGFSFDLNPTFSTGRTALRIHPDGNNKGTLGCVGLQGDGNKNKAFYNLIKSEVHKRGELKMNINIINNPNNNGGKIIPNINE